MTEASSPASVDGPPIPPDQPIPAEVGTTLLQPVTSIPTPGIHTSEFKALVALVVNTIAAPILTKHGIATDTVMTAADVTYGTAVAVYTAARTVLKLFGR